MQTLQTRAVQQYATSSEARARRRGWSRSRQPTCQAHSTERGKQTSPVYRSTTKNLETPSLAPSWLKTQRANGDTHQHAPQIQQQTVLMPHQPTKVMRMVLILEPSLIESISVTIGSQINHGLKDQTHLGIIVGGSAHKVRGIVEVSTIRGCNHNEDC